MPDRDVDAQVQTLYLALFGREADPGGLAFWGARIAASSLERVAATFLASGEFAATFPGRVADENPARADEAYVRALIFNLFDRNATREEVKAGTAALDAGEPPSAFLARLIDEASEFDTQAYRSKLAIVDYRTEARASGDFVPEQITFPFLRSNPEFYDQLSSLDARFDTLALERFGTSLEGNPLFAATLGEGARDLVILTQQHGDEPTGTEGALLFMEFLAGDTASAQAIREALTVTVVPRLNPDGFARWVRETGGERGVPDPRRNEAEIDLNRAFDPAAPLDPAEVPEASAFIDLVGEIDPFLVLDYHNQNLYRQQSGSLDTMSALWPTNDGVAEAVRETAQRATLALQDSLDSFDFTVFTQFPGTGNASLARNGLALAGTPTVLVEQSYLELMLEISRGLDLDYSAYRSGFVYEAFISMKGVAERLADGRFDRLDPAGVAGLTPRGDGISFAELYADDAFLTREELEMAMI